MPKDTPRSGTSSRVLRRLEPYNASPGNRERSRRSSHGSADSTREQGQTTQEPPSWAKELLEQQKQYSTELKKIKKDLGAAERSKQEKPNESEPEFRFEGNKKQNKLNRNVLDKIGSAMATSDDEERNTLLQEGEALLVERNKHICLADKYGWDTVECYTAEPLASDSGDEKRIKKAIKESKQLREEKRKSAGAKWKAKKSVQQDERSRRVVQDKPRSQFSAGKSPSNLSRDSQQLCFRSSEAAISPVNVELQLQVKHPNGPVTQYSHREASNNYVLPTNMDEVEHCSVDLDCVELGHFVYVENVELACATPVNGRLREHLAFWKDIGASKWVLDVLRDGYSLPFMSLPQKAFFNNHGSIAEDQEFVCQEVAKLLASGAVTEIHSTGGVKASEYLHTWMMGLVQTKS